MENTAPINVLQLLRSRTGMNQKEFAEKIGLPKMHISRMERGNRQGWLVHYMPIARFFGVTLDTLVDNDLEAAISSLRGKATKSRSLHDKMLQKQINCNRIGDAGEDYVYTLELQKLAGTKYANAVDANYSGFEDAHFDILSFDLSGELTYIEVKTTASECSDDFFLSAHELEFAKQCQAEGKRYEVHRVYHINNNKKRGRVIITAKELLNEYIFAPVTFAVSRKEAH